MKYKWQVDNIKRELASIDNPILDVDKKKKQIYTSMLFDIGVIEKESRPHIKCDDFFDACMSFDMSYFNTSFFRMLNFLNKAFINLNLDEDVQNVKETSLDYVVSLARDYYKRYDKNNLNYFKKIISNPSRINFVNDKLAHFLGRSYILSSNEYYILITAPNFLAQTSTLVHEAKHVEGRLKGYDNGISLYQELPSYIHELKTLDYLEIISNEKENINIIRKQLIYKYIMMIRKIASQQELIEKLLYDGDFFSTISANYDYYYDEYHFDELYDIMVHGYQASTLSHIISFIVGTDIYLNTPKGNIDNVVSCYLFGMFKMRPNIVEGIIKYVNDVLKPKEDTQSNKMKIIEKQY